MTPRDPTLYEEARRLREMGKPYKRIAAQLQISPSTAHSWTRDIELTPEQLEANRRGPGGPQNPERVARRAAAWGERNRRRRAEWQAEGRAKAREGDPLHLTGCMLYWAEGAKSRNILKLANSDPNMLALFRRFLTDSLGVDPSRLTVRLHVYLGNGLSLTEIEQHWLEILVLPDTCLRKHAVNPLPTSSSGGKRNKLPYGVCTLGLGDTRRVQHIYGAIQEYGGFDEPKWLDGPPRKPRSSSG